MLERKRIPIDHEDFKKIIEDEYYFADKTLMIKDIIDTGSKVNLFTRPRRFGKTLNLSMIKYFFEKTDTDNSFLFTSLNISSCGEKYLSYMGKYPVISLSLKSMKQSTFEDSFHIYKQLIVSEFVRHEKLLNSEKLSQNSRERFSCICSGKAENSEILTALQFLSECLFSEYAQNVIILIDEYDVPLENAYFRGYYDKMTDLIRSTFESVLKTNSCLRFTILTGCLRISKESIFTGLNNLKVYPVTENNFSSYFGFTEDEVLKMLNDKQRM